MKGIPICGPGKGKKNKTITKLSFLTFSSVDFHEEKMALVLHKTVLFNQVCKNTLRQSSRFMCMKANPADTPDYNPNEHHHWAKPPSKENYYRNIFFFNLF